MISSLRCSEHFSILFSHGNQLGACVHLLLRWRRYTVLLALRSTQFASICGASRRFVLRFPLSLLTMHIACTHAHYRHVERDQVYFLCCFQSNIASFCRQLGNVRASSPLRWMKHGMAVLEFFEAMEQHKVLQIRFQERGSSEWARQNLLSSMRFWYQFSRVGANGAWRSVFVTKRARG